MRTIAVEVLLTAAVLSAWLGCFGLLRLETALDRLHCATFVNAASGFAVTLAILVHDGPADRFLKMLAILLIVLLGGAATSHAAGRALALREGARR